MMNILLVDDESYVTESLAQTINWRELGIEQVYQGASAADALELLEEHQIDIVVTDIRMPDIDGLKLVEAIGQRWPDTRCIMLTGHSDFHYAKKAIQLQAFDYILKPVDDEDFIKSVSSAVASLKDEWEQASRVHKLMYNRRSDLTILRANFMHDLVLGHKLPGSIMKQKCEQYEISLPLDSAAVMLLVPLSRTFGSYDHHSISLMEFAVGNIAEEVFAKHYHIWHCKAPHDCLIILAAPKMGADSSGLRDYIAALQRHVSNYLKGDISIVITEFFPFPEGIAAAYRAGLRSIYLSASQKESNLIYLADSTSGKEHSIKLMEQLYKPPTLIHLLESKQWDMAQQKINEVFDEMEQSAYLREHLYEVFLSVTNALLYIAHKHGIFIYQLDHKGFDLFIDQRIVNSLEELRSWSMGMLDKLKDELASSHQYSNSYIIKQVQEMVSTSYGQDVSVKMIADRVYLHPVYLSKIYKAGTGESLSDYIIRMRMERALYLLKNTNMKIYEITSELGYQNPQYFSKMFKKFYGVTPQEYRD